MIEWKNIVRGLAMGVSDLIPGVSGGTTAVVLGIYDRLILSINQLFSRNFKSALFFLVPLGLGIVSALFIFSNVISFLLESYPIPTYFFFFGLILGVIPFLIQKVDAKRTFHVKHFILLIIAALVVALNFSIDLDESSTVMQNLDMADYMLLFGAGWIASSAMLLPGVSGSLFFTILGVYGTLVHALSTINIPVIAVVAVGILVGILVMSKIIRYVLRRYPIATYAGIIGLMLGSSFVILPGIPPTPGLFMSSIVTFVAGLALAFGLGRVEHDH
ncbi:DUF368 domain-containing protein [Salsuginibacillus kocurii]|uniref:DUF368 domain-containing protein n=1 Tax=Salsuginibacillus kocurii TaxID=427078 RepID=UPI0003809CAC|nr:DUF368 domain-containing protein [Salsuginibacillus kocurii]